MPAFIIKRDGYKQAWDRNKLSEVVARAFSGCKEKPDYANIPKITEFVEEGFEGERVVHIEEVQDMLEFALMELGEHETAKHFILYREKRRQSREQELAIVDVHNLIDNYVDLSDWRVSENANMSYSFQGLTLNISGAIQSKYMLNQYSENVRNAHKQGLLHLHDLSYLSAYCAGWSLRDLLLEGFNLKGCCSSGPANHLDSAMSQIVNFIGTLQNEWAGAQAINNLDTLLAPFIRFDKLNYNQIKQSMQRLIYNLNTSSRWGGQCGADSELILNTLSGWTSMDRRTAKRNVIVKLKYLAEKNSCKFNEEDYDGTRTPLPFTCKCGKQTSRKPKNMLKSKKMLCISCARSHVGPPTTISKVPKKVNLKLREIWIKSLNDYLKGTGLTLIEDSVFSGKRPIKMICHCGQEFSYHAADRVITNKITGCVECSLKQCWESQKKYPERIDKICESKKCTPIRTTFNGVDSEMIFQCHCGNTFSKRVSHIKENSVMLCKECYAESMSGSNSPSYNPSLTDEEREIKRNRRVKLPFYSMWIKKCLERDEGTCVISGETKDVCVHHLYGFSQHKQFRRFIENGVTLSRELHKEFHSAKFYGHQTTYDDFAEFYFNKTGKQFKQIDLQKLFNTYSEEPLKVGDEIFTVNQETGLIEKSTVKYITIYNKPEEGLLEIKTENFNQQVTLNHRCLVIEEEGTFSYRNAEELKMGDKLLGLDPQESEVIKSIEPFEDTEKVWCPATDNGTIVMQSGDGTVSLTGNCPFSNVTMDLVCPKHLKDTPVIIGGKPQEETYGDFQEEMDLFNKAFLEVFSKGDNDGRIFSFPIPTYNVTKDFPWESENVKKLLEITAKYGVPYFQNFISGDIDPSDVTSMCCLDEKEDLLIRDVEGIKIVKIGEFVNGFLPEEEVFAVDLNQKIQTPSLNLETKTIEWGNIKGVLKKFSKERITVTPKDGKEYKCEPNHIDLVYRGGEFINCLAEDLKVGDHLVTTRKTSGVDFNNKYLKIGDNVLNERLGEFLGHLYSNGNFLWEAGGVGQEDKLRGLQISLNSFKTEWIEEVKDLIFELFRYEAKTKQDPRYEGSFYIYIYNSKIARDIYKVGCNKAGVIPTIILNSPSSVILSFIETYFKFDGYVARNEIHMDDPEFHRQISLLYSIFGVQITRRTTKVGSQVIHKQQEKSNKTIRGQVSKGFLYDIVPVSELPKVDNRKVTYGEMVSKNKLDSIDGIGESPGYKKFLTKDIALVRITKIEREIFDESIPFYDIEMEDSPYFVYSYGNITHNCRLRLDKREIMKKTGGIFGSGDLTGSLGVVTLNLPRYAYLSNNEEDFFSILKHYAIIAKDSLEFKRKMLEDNMKRGMYPWSKRYLKRGYDGHFSTIGLIGGNEACLNLIEQDITTPEGHAFMIRVLTFLRDLTKDFQEQTGNLYNLEATPAEGTSRRLSNIDKELCEGIIQGGSEEVPFYTNSTFLPVDSGFDAIDAVLHQSELQALYTGGTVFHTFLGEAVSDPGSIKSFILKTFESTKLPYLSITPTFSICESHGYILGEHFECPDCGKDCEVYSRIVGYYRAVKPSWNDSKQEEFKQRVMFDID